MMDEYKQQRISTLRNLHKHEAQGEVIAKEASSYEVEAQSYSTLLRWFADDSIVAAMANKNGVSVEVLLKKMESVLGVKTQLISQLRQDTCRKLVEHNVGYFATANAVKLTEERYA